MKTSIVTRMDIELYGDIKEIRKKYGCRTDNEAQRKASEILKWRQPELEELIKSFAIRRTNK